MWTGRGWPEGASDNPGHPIANIADVLLPKFEIGCLAHSQVSYEHARKHPAVDVIVLLPIQPDRRVSVAVCAAPHKSGVRHAAFTARRRTCGTFMFTSFSEL